MRKQSNRSKKLNLNAETVRELDVKHLPHVAGGEEASGNSACRSTATYTDPGWHKPI